MNHFKNIIRMSIDSLMLLMLFALVALPSSSIGLLSYKAERSQVLSAQDEQEEVLSEKDQALLEEIRKATVSQSTQATPELTN